MIKSAIVILTILISSLIIPSSTLAQSRYWEIQSIDTMKFSRDLARQKSKDPTFDITIDTQVRLIADSGVTHIAIATPYDKEFLPYLRKWVNAARENNLKVWFRGNFSGWEGWFDYEGISREEHHTLTRSFILNNPDLFEDGDIFTSCHECENGGPGDPRNTGDVSGHREFLINDYELTKNSFEIIGKDVKTNYFSMNKNVAKLIMDQKTTEITGGIVTLDHYIQDPKQLTKDINEIAKSSGGRVMIGEFGVPVPDIHGFLTDSSQAQWVEEALSELVMNENVIGINYWTSFGGSTRIWSDSNAEKPAKQVLESYFKPESRRIRILNELGRPLRNTIVNVNEKQYTTDDDGYLNLLYIPTTVDFEFTTDKYNSIKINNGDLNQTNEVILIKSKEGLFFKLQKILYNALGNLLN